MIIIAVVAIIFVVIWLYLKKSNKKVGAYGSNYTYYDTLTDRLDAKLGRDTSPLIQAYLDPENCPRYGDLPTLSQLVSMKQNDPGKYTELVRDGTVKRAVNVKALKTWILLGSHKYDRFKHFMDQVNQLDVNGVDMLNLENALKTGRNTLHPYTLHQA
jgi:hypothetical protein